MSSGIPKLAVFVLVIFMIIVVATYVPAIKNTIDDFLSHIF